MNIGSVISNIRKERKMTQEEFGKLFHVTRQTVSNWENERSYPDLQVLVDISDMFEISLDEIVKEDKHMVKKIDSYKRYKKILIILLAGIAVIGIGFGVYAGVCRYQHGKMYDSVLNAGFKKEMTEEWIEKYQGYYAMTEEGVDYLVEPKAIGKNDLDNENYSLIARKGDQDITIIIDPEKKIYLSLYPGNIEIDEHGEVLDKDAKLTDTQKQHLNDLLVTRKDEITPIITRAMELWDAVNS